MPLPLTRQDMQEKLAHAFDREQTASLVDVLDNFREAELERAADTRELKEGLATLTQEVRKLTTAQQRTDSRLAEHQERTEEQFGRIDRLFTELVTIQQRTEGRLGELAVAQQQTEGRLGELAVAQQRTEGRLEELAVAQQRTEGRLEELAVAQQRTEGRLEELAVAQQRTEGRLEELAVAQQRTEGRLEELAVAQRQTVEQLGELATAQKRTEERVAHLDVSVQHLSKSVGTLANDFGFSLEEFTAALLPPYLERYLGISGLDLQQQSFEMGGEEVEEVDLVGEGQRDGQSVLILVECRAKVGGGETRRLSRKLARVAALNPEVPAVPIIVAMNIHPTAKAAAKDTGVLLLPYSRINRDRG